MEKKFANRVSYKELAWFLYDMKKAGWNINCICDLEEQLDDNVFYYSKRFDYPNIMLGEYVFELTDFSLVKHTPANAFGFEDNYQFYPEQSIEFAEKEVKMFLLMKFGQEYLDFLFGPDVATLNPSFIERSEKEQGKGLSRKLKRKYY